MRRSDWRGPQLSLRLHLCLKNPAWTLNKPGKVRGREGKGRGSREEGGGRGRGAQRKEKKVLSPFLMRV